MAVLCRMPAIHIFAGEIYDGCCALENFRPLVNLVAIPMDVTNCSGLVRWFSSQDNDFVTLR